ncbi:ATP-NAD kinase [Suhomyces tanzawaensis NRRL Y-17324]|uniref:ATP-NAD kinase n=1 Tax=Suhomyces tanzawaensis NRRL Y-17324 TaxID=984487 RepID=A0A1E4SIN2_9ASCO|nr:ATP-NAD kinase [Suhomyces tanzawaensis NRRL Y-17324]ODV79361.1 ATP-NAD kinase [Suhomyces tanzawaensis NRRL Y-17324]
MTICHTLQTAARGSSWTIAAIRRAFSSPALPAGSSAGTLEIRSCRELTPAKFPEYVAATPTNLHNMIWRSPLQNVYVVKKPWNARVRDAMVQFIDHIHHEYAAVNIIVSEDVADELAQEWKGSGRRVVYTGPIGEIVARTDLVVTMGGDGTILRAVSAFSSVGVPPVLSFSMGTLGFLLPFDFSTFKHSFRQVYESRAKALHRHRLECYVKRTDSDTNRALEGVVGPEKVIHAMNDITLHRGSQPHLTSLDIFIDHELLTTTTCDGVVISTPTGSTAYSLSAGGSIAHPLVPCILLTPICPRSLLFRPLVLPVTSHVSVRLSEENRNRLIKLTIDGIAQRSLRPGDEICVSNPEHELVKLELAGAPGIWCVARTENDWTNDINEMLGFNSSFGKV